MNKNIHSKLLSLGIFTPIIFFILMYVVLPLLYPGYNSMDQHISQLGGVNSPVSFYANFFGFYLFGVSIIIFSLAVFRLPKLSIGNRISSIFLFITGVSISLVSFFPCDVSCNVLSQTGFIHLALAGIQLFFLILTVIIFSLSKPLRKENHAYIKFIFFLWLLPSSIWFSNIIFGFHVEGVGLIQRISLAMTYAFVVIQGITYSRYYKELSVSHSNKQL